jgi:hypothetical protein
VTEHEHGAPVAPSSLAEKMDFSIGKEFEQDMRHRFGVQVHHESPSSRGSFYLLATFHRFLFRLTEETLRWFFNLVWAVMLLSFMLLR